jgi:hypothetical protein
VRRHDVRVQFTLARREETRTSTTLKMSAFSFVSEIRNFALLSFAADVHGAVGAVRFASRLRRAKALTRATE